jgi:serine protease AprX
MRKIQIQIQIFMVLILVAGLLAPAMQAQEGASAARLQPQLAALAASSPEQVVQVIVQKTSQSDHVEQRVAELGGEVTKDLALINAFAAQLTARAAGRLATSPAVRWVSLDAPLRRSVLYEENVRDEFNTISYNGNDGLGTWAGDWIEVNENDGPGDGDERIVEDQGDTRLRVRDNRGGGEGVQRSVDLSGALAAMLTFEYRRRGLDNSSDYVAVEISADGGATWTTLNRFAGPATDSGYQVWEADISAFISADTTIRFLSSPTNGGRDEVYFDNIEVSYTLGEPEPTGELKAVADDFEAVPYTFENNSGSQNWTGPWLESGEGDGPELGKLQIVNWGDTRGLRFEETGLGVWRTADLSGATQATLQFDFGAVDFEAADFLRVEVSANGGSDWTELDQIHNLGLSSLLFQLYTYDISGFISAGTAVRFTAEFGQGDTAATAFLDNIRIIYTGENSFPTTNTYLETLNVTSVRALRWTGSGVTVAIVDSGITPDPDFGYEYDQTGELLLTPRVIEGAPETLTDPLPLEPLTQEEMAISLVSGSLPEEKTRIVARVAFNPDSEILNDNFGHGTHVAGIVGGSGAKSKGLYQGVAPGINLVGLKVNDDYGMAYESDTVAALQWIQENKDIYNIRVVNLSLNSTVEDSYHNSPLDAALEILWFNGVVVVVSSGNYGSGVQFNTINAAPANDPFVITVGASHESGTPEVADDFVALFTGRGVTQDGHMKPELIAPGKDIISVLATSSWWRNDSPDRFIEGGYFRISGTSMAAPMVAGGVALLLQAEPDLTPDQVKYRLMTCSNTIGLIWDFAYLDLAQAFTCGTTESANQGIVPHVLLARMAMIAYWASQNGGEMIDWANIDWDAVNWDAIDWDAVNWNAVNWNAVNWNAVNWNAVNWNSVNWNAVNWNAVNWNSVNWNSVNWNSVNWNSVNWNE